MTSGFLPCPRRKSRKICRREEKKGTQLNGTLHHRLLDTDAAAIVALLPIDRVLVANQTV